MGITVPFPGHRHIFPRGDQEASVAWILPGPRAIPRSGRSFRVPPGLPTCDFPPALQRTDFLRSATVRVTHGASHRGCLCSESLPLLRECYGEGRHGTGFKSSSLSTPLQTMGKDDSSEVARGRQTQAPGTKGGSGLELIGRYLINVG